MKNSTAARLRRRGQLAEIGYWGVVVPSVIICWLVREAAAMISDTWPLWAGLASAGAAWLGFALIMSGATTDAQRLLGATLLAVGCVALTTLLAAFDD